MKWLNIWKSTFDVHEDKGNDEADDACQRNSKEKAYFLRNIRTLIYWLFKHLFIKETLLIVCINLFKK